MKNSKRYTGYLSDLERMPSSVNGNPRYRASLLCLNDTEDRVTDAPQFVTSVDSSLGYSLPNYRHAFVTVTLGEHYGRLTLADIDYAEHD